jgi:hypothetical protein
MTDNNRGYDDRVGWYIGPKRVALLLRPLLSLLGGIVYTSPFVLMDVLVGTHVLDGTFVSILAVLLALFVWLSEDETLAVPNEHAAIVKFFGARIRVYLTEGDYAWRGNKIFFSVSNTPIPGLAELENQNQVFAKLGLIHLGEIPIKIWNSAEEEQKTLLSNVARDSSTVFTTLTIVVRILNPRKWMNSSDPVLDIAERARGSFRTALSFFTGVDIAGIKTVLVKLMMGETIVTSFLRKQVGTNPALSMVESGGGEYLYHVLEKGEDLVVAKENFATRLKDENDGADQDMYEVVLSKDGTPIVESRSVEAHMADVMSAVGAVLERASVGDINLSAPVAEKANQAASEPFQQMAQVASARATKAGREILTLTPSQMRDPATREASQLATLIAAAQDNPGIQIVVVPGGDSLTRAAVAGGKQIGGKTK